MFGVDWPEQVFAFWARPKIRPKLQKPGKQFQSLDRPKQPNSFRGLKTALLFPKKKTTITLCRYGKTTCFQKISLALKTAQGTWLSRSLPPELFLLASVASIGGQLHSRQQRPLACGGLHGSRLAGLTARPKAGRRPRSNSKWPKPQARSSRFERFE